MASKRCKNPCLRLQRLCAKTRFCKYYLAGETCPHGGNCSFAHGDHELRSVPDLSHTRACLWYAAGACAAGAKCKFTHERSLAEPGQQAVGDLGKDLPSDSAARHSGVASGQLTQMSAADRAELSNVCELSSQEGARPLPTQLGDDFPSLELQEDRALAALKLSNDTARRSLPSSRATPVGIRPCAASAVLPSRVAVGPPPSAAVSSPPHPRLLPVIPYRLQASTKAMLSFLEWPHAVREAEHASGHRVYRKNTFLMAVEPPLFSFAIQRCKSSPASFRL
eukprot:TRINITY_DN94132_c0_g1_i1.p1 TRINITY_DN94132_c0_g1~~TRINITY_DN94132_c0_g1_i1.p1  ORF type:complete len:280 (-),score=21.77 TRINITY_DN94132_c0_g1_i1:69-908(-)